MDWKLDGESQRAALRRAAEKERKVSEAAVESAEETTEECIAVVNGAGTPLELVDVTSQMNPQSLSVVGDGATPADAPTNKTRPSTATRDSTTSPGTPIGTALSISQHADVPSTLCSSSNADSSPARTESPSNSKDIMVDDTQTASRQASRTSLATRNRNKRSASAPPASIHPPKRIKTAAKVSCVSFLARGRHRWQELAGSGKINCRECEVTTRYVGYFSLLSIFKLTIRSQFHPCLAETNGSW